MGLIFTILFFLALSAILSVLCPERSSSKLWLVAWTWRHIGKPVRDYLLRRVTTAKVVYRYFGAMMALNASSLLFNVFRVRTGNFMLEFSVDPINASILLVDILLTLVAVIYLTLQFFKSKDNILVEDNTERILEALANKNDEIKELLPLYRCSIEKLHIKEAYEHLGAIRKIVVKRSATDYELLATIDFLMGKCSCYIKGNDEKVELVRAFEEMKKANLFLIEIVEEYIYINIKRNEKQSIIDLCHQILEREPNNAMANAALVVLSDDAENTYKKVPKSVLSEINFQFVIFYYIFNHPDQEWLSVDDVQCDIPKNLTYDNLRQWSFCMSIYSTRLLREGYYFCDGRKITQTLRNVYDITSRYKELSAGTDIENIIPDVEFMALYSEFLLIESKEKRNELISLMKDCKPSKENMISYVLMLLEMLMINKDFDDAARVLEEQKDCKDETLALAGFLLPTRTFDKQLAVKAFEHFSKISILLPDMHCQPILSCVAMYAGDVLQFKNLKIFENPITQQIFEYTLMYFSTKACDVETIKTLAEKAPKEAKFILAKILGSENHTGEALAIIKPLIQEGVYSVEMCAYLSIIREDENYKDVYFDTLKKLRKNGIIPVKELLEDEYYLAINCNDLTDAGEVISLLFEQYPNNNSVFSNYLTYLNLTRQNDKFAEYVGRVLNTVEDNPNLNCNFFNLLVLQEYYKEGLDFLYSAILRTKSQKLKDLWFEFMHTPHISPIINEEKTVVENGDFVVYEENDQVKSEEVFINSNTEKLIGHHIGEKVTLDRFGIISTAKIQCIFNKYQSLTRQIYQDIQKGQSKSIRMFTLDDLKGGDGNMLTNLMMLAGGLDNKRRIEDWEKRYAKGEAMLFSSFGDSNAYEKCLNRIFGNDRIYSLPYQNYEKCPIGDYECVLDITSVVLLSMLNKICGLTFDKKFIIPQGLSIYIRQTLQREKVNIPSYISQNVVERLKLKKKSSENCHIEVLQYILDWIDKYCIIEVATKKLNLHFKESKHSFFEIESESMLLTIDNKRCMISEDWGLMTNYENFKILNTEAFLYLLNVNEKLNISKLLADFHFVGVNVDLDYMLEQYHKKNSRQPNTFDECLEALRINMYLTEDGLNLANQILCSKIKLSSDSIIVLNIFGKILEGKTTIFRKDLIEQIKNQQGLHPDFMKYLVDSIKINQIVLV